MSDDDPVIPPWEFVVHKGHKLEPGDIIRMTGPGSYEVIRPSDHAAPRSRKSGSRNRRWFEDDSLEMTFVCILFLVGMFPAAWLLVGALT